MADMTAQFAIQVLTDQAMRDVKAFGNAAVRTLNQAGTQATGKLSSGLGTLEQRLASGQQQVDAFNAKWGNTLRLGQQVGAGMTAVGGAMALGLGKAYQAAAQFDQGMRNVNSIAQLNTEEFDKLTKAVKGIASDNKVLDTAPVLAEGLYDIYSSGLQGAQALEALEIASKGASAGMSDTATASNVLVAAMNAYDKKGPGDAARIMDVLFKTVDRGVVTFPQLAGSMGNVMGTASQVGVSIEELGAGLATMTKQGIGAEEAVTSLNAIMMAFLTPSKDMEAAIKAAGYESGLAIVKAKGLAGAVEFLTEASNGNQDTMAGMLGNVRAIRGAMALTGAGAKTFAGDLDAMKNSAGAMGAALDEQSKGAIFRQREALKQLSNAAIALGDGLKTAFAGVAPVLSKVAEGLTWILNSPLGPVITGAAIAFTGLMITLGPLLMALPGLISSWQLLSAAIGPAGTVGAVAALKGALPALAARLGGFATTTIPGVVAAIKGMGASLSGIAAAGTGPIAIAIAAVAALAIELYYLKKRWDEAAAAGKQASENFKQAMAAEDAYAAKTGTQAEVAKQREERENARVTMSDRFWGAMTGGGKTGKDIARERAWMGQAIPRRAGGGPVHAGGMYIVGEEGPELFRPKQGGEILPNADKEYQQDYLRGSANPVWQGISTGLSRAGIGGLQKKFMAAAAERGYNIGANIGTRSVTSPSKAASMATQSATLPPMLTDASNAQIGAGSSGPARGGLNVTINVQGNIYGDAELKRRIREEVYSVVREAVFA